MKGIKGQKQQLELICVSSLKTCSLSLPIPFRVLQLCLRVEVSFFSFNCISFVVAASCFSVEQDG